MNDLEKFAELLIAVGQIKEKLEAKDREIESLKTEIANIKNKTGGASC